MGAFNYSKINKNSPDKIIIFDTTMQDGELAGEVKMNFWQKMELATETILEALDLFIKYRGT